MPAIRRHSGRGHGRQIHRLRGLSQGQKIIQDYGKDKYGEGLYNDAAYAKQYDE